jgi:S1-C subfamily serine protease
MVCLSVAASVQADDESDLRLALALEKTIQKAIVRAEPAVACILVSRSGLYQKIGQDPGDIAAGKLGSFDPSQVSRFTGVKPALRESLALRLDLGNLRNIPEAFGSGVVVDAKGLVLTNYHVVRDATKIFVRLPSGKGSYADIHAADPRSDLAVLRLLEPDLSLPVIPMGDGGKLERGSFILSLANPFAAGFRDGQPSASWGIVSNLRRRVLTDRKEEETGPKLHQHGNLIQIDARLNLGCSGGALCNLQGELVGLTSAWAGIQGGETPGGFAIPLDARTRRILDVLLRGEEVEYGFLGVGFEERALFDDPRGIVVSHVYIGSPAQVDAKLAPGDRLVAVNGEPIRNSDELFLHLSTYLAGSRIHLEYARGTARRGVDVTLAKFLIPGKGIYSSPGGRPWVRGLRVDNASLLVQQPPAWEAIPRGVLVSEVEPGSAAAEARLKPGEVITHVDGIPVTAPAEFYRAMEGLDGPVEFRLYHFAKAADAPRVVVK